MVDRLYDREPPPPTAPSIIDFFRIRCALPQFPGRGSLAIQLLQFLPLFERVHALPETVVAMAHELFCADEPLKWLPHEFLACFDVLENRAFEDKVAAVDPDV